jgi:PAS domain S-box-containing protein
MSGAIGSTTDGELKALRDEIARLRQDNAQLRNVLQTIPVAVLIKDRDSRFLYTNPPGALGYGVPAEQVIGRFERDLMPLGNPTLEYLAQDREVIDTGKPATIPEFMFKAADGNTYCLHIMKYPVFFAGRKAVLVVVYDLTHQKRLADERELLERKVQEKQRLESLGVMAGGIAHDFNNLLVGVLANADLALAKTPADSAATRYLERLRAAGQRLTALSRQMLAYSGRGRFETELLDLSSVTDELLGLLEASIAKNVRVEMELPSGLPLVRVDPAQIRQVIMNLITNAAEAIGERAGTVHLRAAAEHFDPQNHPKLTLGAELPTGEYVCLEVRDDGEGMSPRTLARLFDPFFTTKTSGRGLGLAAVLGIVRSHRGALEVHTVEGRGTTFRVWLPVARASVTSEPLPRAPEPELHARGRRVLVVDDELIVRQAATAVLETFGFVVETAENGDRALELMQMSGASLDAVVLDMSMPGRSVRETYAGIRALRPSLPVVLTSGFTELEVIDELVRQRSTVFVQKPFSAQELVDKLYGLMTN